MVSMSISALLVEYIFFFGFDKKKNAFRICWMLGTLSTPWWLVVHAVEQESEGIESIEIDCGGTLLGFFSQILTPLNKKQPPAHIMFRALGIHQSE